MSRHLIINFYLFRKISSPDFSTTSGVANTSPKQDTLSWIWNGLSSWKIFSFPWFWIAEVVLQPVQTWANNRYGVRGCLFTRYLTKYSTFTFFLSRLLVIANMMSFIAEHQWYISNTRISVSSDVWWCFAISSVFFTLKTSASPTLCFFSMPISVNFCQRILMNLILLWVFHKNNFLMHWCVCYVYVCRRYCFSSQMLMCFFLDNGSL